MLRSRLALAFVAVMVSAPAFAQVSVPHFWDTRQRLSAPDLTTIQRLRFLTTTDFFPFSMLDPQGNLVGFHVDLARAICSKLSIDNRCQIQAMPFEELGEALERGEGEAILAGIAVTAETRATYDFSRPYFQFPARFIVRQDARLAEPLYATLKGQRVGVLAGSAHEEMLRDFFDGVTAAPFEAEQDLFAAIRNGDVRAIFGDGLRLSFALTGEETDGCCSFAGGPYLAPEYFGHGLTIATRDNQPLLQDALNFALQQLEADGVFTELYLRYFPVDFYEQLP